MNNVKYYYNFGEEQDQVIKNELESFDQVKEKLNEFKLAFEEKDGKRCPIINVWVEPDISSILTLSASYEYNKKKFFKFFSLDEYLLQVVKTENDGKKAYYTYSTKNFDELSSIFFEFIENQKAPDLSKWERNVVLSE